MKAGILKNIEQLTVEEIPDPSLQKGSVIVKVKRCSVCNTDLRIYHYGHERIKLPQVIGHEVSGEIEAVDDEVTNYKVGDRVAITPRIACGECFYCKQGQHIYCQNSLTFGYELQGGYAERLLVPSSGLKYGVINRIADGLSFEEASLAEPLSCCIRAQKTSRVGHGDTVIVMGGGPVGIMHCRVAKANNAHKVILVDKEIRRLESIDLASVDNVIDSAVSDLKVKITTLTKSRGADVIIIACSSAEAQEQALTLAGRGGRINFFGGLPLNNPHISIDSNLIHYNEILIQGSHGSIPYDNRTALDMIARKVVQVSDLITHTFPLDSIKEAFLFVDSKVGMRVTIRT